MQAVREFSNLLCLRRSEQALTVSIHGLSCASSGGNTSFCTNHLEPAQVGLSWVECTIVTRLSNS